MVGWEADTLAPMVGSVSASGRSCIPRGRGGGSFGEPSGDALVLGMLGAPPRVGETEHASAVTLGSGGLAANSGTTRLGLGGDIDLFPLELPDALLATDASGLREISLGKLRNQLGYNFFTGCGVN